MWFFLLNAHAAIVDACDPTCDENAVQNGFNSMGGGDVLEVDQPGTYRGGFNTSFQTKTVESAMELIGAAGFTDPAGLRPYHIVRRTSRTQVENLESVYPRLKPGAFVAGEAPAQLQEWWAVARRWADRAPKPGAPSA